MPSCALASALSLDEAQLSLLVVQPLLVVSLVLISFYFFLLTAALSIKFGYGLPAALALALACAFCFGVNGVDFFLGFGLSQNATFFFIYFLSSNSR